MKKQLEIIKNIIAGVTLLAVAFLPAGFILADTSTTTNATSTDTTSATSTTPVISSINASSTTDGLGATLTWTTDQTADSQVQYGTTTSYGTFSARLDQSPMVTTHSLALSNLAQNTMYHFQIFSRNASGMIGTSSDQTFMTATATSTATTTAPLISAVSTSAGTATASAMWTTDQMADSQVLYGTTTSYGSSTTRNTTLATNHLVNISGLTVNDGHIERSNIHHNDRFIDRNGNNNCTSNHFDQFFSRNKSGSYHLGDRSSFELTSELWNDDKLWNIFCI